MLLVEQIYNPGSGCSFPFICHFVLLFLPLSLSFSLSLFKQRGRRSFVIRRNGDVPLRLYPHSRTTSPTTTPRRLCGATAVAARLRTHTRTTDRRTRDEGGTGSWLDGRLKFLPADRLVWSRGCVIGHDTDMQKCTWFIMGPLLIFAQMEFCHIQK